MKTLNKLDKQQLGGGLAASRYNKHSNPTCLKLVQSTCALKLCVMLSLACTSWTVSPGCKPCAVKQFRVQEMKRAPYKPYEEAAN